MSALADVLQRPRAMVAGGGVPGIAAARAWRPAGVRRRIWSAAEEFWPPSVVMKPTTESNATKNQAQQETVLLDQLRAAVGQWYATHMPPLPPAPPPAADGQPAQQPMPLAALVNILHRNPELFGLPRRK